jgi:hypothetical protein
MDRNEPGTLLIGWQGADGFEEFMARIEIPYIRAFDIHPRAGERRVTRTLCLTVSMTSSIWPLSTCLAMLSVKPLAVAAGTWEGRAAALGVAG